MHVERRHAPLRAGDGARRRRAWTSRQGEFVTLLGPRAAARRRCCASSPGFVRPTEGRVAARRPDVTRVPPHKRPVNMVFQRADAVPAPRRRRQRRLRAAHRAGVERPRRRARGRGAAAGAPGRLRRAARARALRRPDAAGRAGARARQPPAGAAAGRAALGARPQDPAGDGGRAAARAPRDGRDVRLRHARPARGARALRPHRRLRRRPGRAGRARRRRSTTRPPRRSRRASSATRTCCRSRYARRAASGCGRSGRRADAGRAAAGGAGNGPAWLVVRPEACACAGGAAASGGIVPRRRPSAAPAYAYGSTCRASRRRSRPRSPGEGAPCCCRSAARSACTGIQSACVLLDAGGETYDGRHSDAERKRGGDRRVARHRPGRRAPAVRGGRDGGGPRPARRRRDRRALRGAASTTSRATSASRADVGAPSPPPTSCSAGPPDVLVCVAGIAPEVAFMDTTPEVLRPGVRGQRARRLPVRPGGGAADARGGRRAHRQHRLDGERAGLVAAAVVRRVEGRGRAADEEHGDGARAARASRSTPSARARSRRRSRSTSWRTAAWAERNRRTPLGRSGTPDDIAVGGALPGARRAVDDGAGACTSTAASWPPG